MFNLNYEGRLSKWREFRETLEDSPKPINDVVQFYRLAPTVSIHTDPFNNKTWPGPWELLHENQYCIFCKVLGMCYTLQLTESFKDSKFEIIIARDIESNTRLYLLSIDKSIIGLNDNYVHVDELPESVITEKNYLMPELQ